MIKSLKKWKEIYTNRYFIEDTSVYDTSLNKERDMTTVVFILEFLVIVSIYFLLNRRIKVLEAQHQIESKTLKDIYEKIKDKIVERD